jgi:hypothetical protein
MAEIVRMLPERVVVPALTYPGIWELLDTGTLTDRGLAHALQERYDRVISGPAVSAISSYEDAPGVDETQSERPTPITLSAEDPG